MLRDQSNSEFHGLDIFMKLGINPAGGREFQVVGAVQLKNRLPISKNA